MFFGNNAGLGQSKPMGQNKIWKHGQRHIRPHSGHQLHADALAPLPEIYPDDDGGYEVGLDEPAFPTRRFAELVRLRGTRHSNRWLRQ